jgi:hypothetical protein
VHAGAAAESASCAAAAAMTRSEVRQEYWETSHAANGAIIIGAMPMPAETSDTAKLRYVSNQPVTQAVIGRWPNRVGASAYRSVGQILRRDFRGNQSIVR